MKCESSKSCFCQRVDTIAEYCVFIKVLMSKLKNPRVRGYRAGPQRPAAGNQEAEGRAVAHVPASPTTNQSHSRFPDTM